jgi:hypothetical protein
LGRTQRAKNLAEVSFPHTFPKRSAPLYAGDFGISGAGSKTVVGGFVPPWSSNPTPSPSESQSGIGVRQRLRPGPASKPLGSRCAEVNAGQRESAEAVAGFHSPEVPPERRGPIHHLPTWTARNHRATPMDRLVARGCGVSFDEVLQPPDSVDDLGVVDAG